MNIMPYKACFQVAIVVISGLAGSTARADDTNSPAAAQPVPTPSARAVAAPRLPYGVEDVLNLSRARISEEVIVNYIRNSGTAYMLGPREIVILRDEGVSDHVINTMMDQRKKVAEDNAQQAVQQATQQAAQQAIQSPGVVAAPAAPGAPLVYDPNAFVPVPYPLECDLSVEEDRPAPSTLYVIPDPAVRAAYYGSSPYAFSGYGYGVGYPVYYGVGRSMVYHFGGRCGGCTGRGAHSGGYHTVSHR